MSDSPEARTADLILRLRRGERDFPRVNLKGATLHKTDLGRADLHGANLSGAQLTGADLTDADISGADLSGANLSWATLTGTNLSGADLSGADLSGTKLVGADFTRANLTRANLSSADLIMTNFGQANLSGTNFSDAWCLATIFAAVNLRTTIGVESINHGGPSTVGIDTLYKSGGEIPDTFLRGCGIPNEFITYARSLVGTGIEFYSCFVSYSTVDQAFAERLHSDLQARNIRCWFAPHDVQGGKKLHSQIDDAIRTHDKLLLLLSEHSMSSEWVKTEIRRARKQEKSRGKRVLFPVRLCSFDAIRAWELFDADEGNDLAVEIREYFIPDFSLWKDHDAYQDAFTKLLRDLKAIPG